MMSSESHYSVSLRQKNLTLHISRGQSPLGYKQVFLSTDDHGNSVGLNDFFLEEFGIDEYLTKDKISKDLQSGVRVVQAGNSYLIYIVTVSSSSKLEDLLKTNLTKALDNKDLFFSDKPLSVWLPLMGTGLGGHDFLDSARITAEVLLNTLLRPDLNDEVSGEITISLPSTTNDDDFNQVIEIFNTVLDGRQAETIPQAWLLQYTPRGQSGWTQNATTGRIIKWESGKSLPAEMKVGDVVLYWRTINTKNKQDRGGLVGTGKVISLERTKENGVFRLPTKIEQFNEEQIIDRDRLIKEANIKRKNWQGAILSLSPEETVGINQSLLNHGMDPIILTTVIRDDVITHSDEPTKDDQLARRPFANFLVKRMNDVQAEGAKDGFAVHLHAPWGAGKTSLLYMMEDQMRGFHVSSPEIPPLQGEGQNTLHDDQQHWVVVHFNAWQHERRNPPWWPLLEAVKRDCAHFFLNKALGQVGGSKDFPARMKALWNWIKLQVRWYWSNLSADLLPLCLALIVLGVVFYNLFFVDGAVTGNAGKDRDSLDNLVDFWTQILKSITGLAAAVGVFVAAGKAMVFGSSENAKYNYQLSNDPLVRVKTLFARIIKMTDRPVCIFIDDLDRCHADFVVDLLEGIQTSFRNPKVAYVIAADKGWIRSSFETRYARFAQNVGDAGLPLGYLFLEKIFQISTPLPGMGAEVKQAYWNDLLGEQKKRKSERGPADEERLETEDEVGEKLFDVQSESFSKAVAERQQQLQQKFPQGFTAAEADKHLATIDNAVERVAVIYALDDSKVAEKEAEHLMSQFSSLLSDNPRAMKRMVNVFAMRRAIRYLEFSTVPMDVLARWTILEQRFPALADVLIIQPDLISFVGDKNGDPETWPKVLQPFMSLKELSDIVMEEEKRVLTPELIREVTKVGGG